MPGSWFLWSIFFHHYFLRRKGTFNHSYSEKSSNRATYRLLPKICDWAKCYNRHRPKNIWVTRLFFCQNDSLMGESFWQKDSLVTFRDSNDSSHFYTVWIMTIMIFSPVANFGQQSLAQICYDLQSAGINVHSAQSVATHRRLTLDKILKNRTPVLPNLF